MKAHGTSDWGKLLDRSDVLILDTETTGAGKWAEVVDVAVIDTTGAVLYESAVLPASNVPRDAEADPEASELLLLRAKGARPWPECYESIIKLLARADTVCAYNAAHDERVLNQTSIRYGFVFPPIVRWRCLMMDYAAHRQIAQGSGGWQRHKLEEAAAHEGVLWGEQAHEALPDCQLTLSLMRAVTGQGALEDNSRSQMPEYRTWPAYAFFGYVLFWFLLSASC